mmetsp:Transcript_92878/g.300331  ORF Transcript_92878/g.300331 Transcript_92878/m.300331 type:complete len:159 (-) Transcript_92878:21-497(-)
MVGDAEGDEEEEEEGGTEVGGADETPASAALAEEGMSATAGSSPPSGEGPTPVRRRGRPPKSVEAAPPSVSMPSASPQSSSSASPNDIRRKVIDCLLSNNGLCTGQAVVEALGVDSRDKNNPFYRETLAAIREVADVKQVGKARVLVLKRELGSARTS